MKKGDIITTLVYCLIMVIALVILFLLNMPTLFSIALYGFLFFAAFSNIFKKFFVVKKKVNYREFNFDNDFNHLLLPILIRAQKDLLMKRLNWFYQMSRVIDTRYILTFTMFRFPQRYIKTMRLSL